MRDKIAIIEVKTNSVIGVIPVSTASLLDIKTLLAVIQIASGEPKYKVVPIIDGLGYVKIKGQPTLTKISEIPAMTEARQDIETLETAKNITYAVEE